MTFWEWLAFAGTLASILTLFSFWSDHRMTKLITNMHAATQLTLKDISKGFQESQQQLGNGISELGRILERMDQRADERHREVVNIIDSLRRP